MLSLQLTSPCTSKGLCGDERPGAMTYQPIAGHFHTMQVSAMETAWLLGRSQRIREALESTAPSSVVGVRCHAEPATREEKKRRAP